MNFFKTTLFTLLALTLLVVRPHDPLIFAQTDMSTARRSSDTPALVAQSAAPTRPLGQVQVLSGPDTCAQEETVPNTPHPVPSTREGAEKIRDIVLAECRLQ